MGPRKVRVGAAGDFATQNAPREGVVVKELVPSLESSFSSSFEDNDPVISREFCRHVPDPWGGVQKVCTGQACAHASLYGGWC